MENSLDAPIYMPAEQFAAPIRQPRALNTHDVAIADLMAIAGVKETILKQIPAMNFLMKIPDMQPHLGNLTLWDLVHIGLMKEDGISAIDQQLATLEKSR
ncbi:hypothetical protein L288_10310 [Sphingobium quisquiliarum P25]|uniref:Uncharacterized protein n=1 Tax=Sphingobium quisquiliarum P25 TaxID=1329909 RepID=T0H248_9SPHN|nr:hypothetical protein L288_10310 [Sphingobium quisquiliarum P25]